MYCVKLIVLWRTATVQELPPLKVPKCEIFDSFFYTNKSYMGRWLEDWINFCFFSKTNADIRHFVFFAHAKCALKKRPTQAEPALKKCLGRLSLRKKNAYAGWACAKKNCQNREKIYAHGVCAKKLPIQAEPALKIKKFQYLKKNKKPLRVKIFKYPSSSMQRSLNVNIYI